MKDFKKIYKILFTTFFLSSALNAQTTFSNTADVCPLDGNTTGSTSVISVSGIPQSIASVTVSIPNISHTFYDDLDIMLISPTGQRIILMSDCGGDNSGTGNRSYTFVQGGTALNNNAQPTASGNVSPTNFQAETWPDGAATITAMNQFTGNPNGNWTLRVIDDAGTDTGCLIGGWSITITPAQFKTTWVSMNTGTANWCAGETRSISVTITNAGSQAWNDAIADYNIGVKWNAEADYIVRVDAQNLAPGATQTFNMTVTAPTTTGANNLTFDVVREGCFWFANNTTSCGVTAGPNNTTFVSSGIIINSVPTPISVTPTTATICSGDSPVLLTASGGLSSITLLNENFNGTPVGWTTSNSSTGGIPANAAWTLRPNSYNTGYEILNSNDNSQFYLSNSDAQGSGGSTNTSLTSPVFNTLNAVSGTVSFYHRYYDDVENGVGRVQYSVDGTNYTDIISYSSDNGNPSPFSIVTLALPSGALNQSNVTIRFAYTGNWAYYWAVDNFFVSVSKPNVVWSPTTGLDPDGTGPQPPYSGGHAYTLYASPTSTQTYTLTATNSNGCSASASTTITVNPILTASVAIAASANPACLGNSVTFTATPTNGGTSPAYVWMKNGTPIGGATSVTYTGVAGTDFVSSDQIACILTSNATPCLAGSPATSAAITMTVNAAAPTNTPGTYTSTVVNHVDGTTQTYNFDNCTSLGQITDAAGGNVLGNTTMTSTVAASILTTNPSGYVYLRRGYTISPASDGAMTLKMYFTQQDFDNYNATAVDFLSLPTSGSNSDPNIQFFRIATVIGGVHTISAPLGATGLTWNGTHWEFTMNVTSVAGAQYYVATMPSCSGIAVSNLTPTNVTTDAVTATWTSVVTTPSWGWYGFRYRVVGASTWVDAGTANNPATSRVINGLVPGTNYELQIRRHCSSQSEGPWSASVFFTTLGGGCGSPMIFNTPTATASSATLTWTAVPGAAWYEFEYKLAASSTWISAGTLIGSGTTRTISGLVTGSTYNYRGRTYCSSGTASPWSIIGTVTTTSASGCSLPPVISTSTITGTSATITWPTVVGAAWYEFRYKQSSSGTWITAGTLGSTATSRVLSGLISGTQYDFQARTFCSSGVPSAWSTTLQFTTSGLAACESAPVISTSTISGTTATITWTAIPGAGWYEFRYKATSSGTWITAGTLVGTGTSKTLTGLTPNTQYDFQARTFCNSTSGSTWGSTLQFTTGASAMILNDEVTVLESNSANFIEKQIVLDAIEVKMYPNPTDGLVAIELNSSLANEDLLVKVVDMSGRLVQLINSKTVEGTTLMSLDLSTMSNGVYTVELYKSNSIVSRTKIYKN